MNAKKDILQAVKERRMTPAEGRKRLEKLLHADSYLLSSAGVAGMNARSRQMPVGPVMEKQREKNVDLIGSAAIIGMAGRFPQADTIDRFWENIKTGKDCIENMPDDRWSQIHERAEQVDPDFRGPNGMGAPKGGFLKNVDLFDPLFFNIPPKEAEVMDPQQRLLLMYIWKAIEDAGVTPAALSHSPTGVFVSSGMNGYKNIVSLSKDDPFAVMTSVVSTYPNRVSYILNLTGPSEHCEAGCSSSLVGLHHAITAMHCGECDQAIIAAVNLFFSAKEFSRLDALGHLSPQGRPRSFGAEADGYVRSEAVAAMLIKPLQKAVDDNDRIYAVIRGTGVSHGGRGMSLTAPTRKGMKMAMRQAYRASGLEPGTVSYVEAHGTATPMGDAIEIEALKEGYAELSPPGTAVNAPCYISTLKPCIGHVETVAGLAAVIKAVMALRHKTIPGLPGFRHLNENISLDDSRFRIMAENRPWPAPPDTAGKALPRRAAVNSYGFGGVNAHVIIEAYNGKTGAGQRTDTPCVFVLSARTEERLRAYAKKMLAFLASFPGDIADVAYTLQVGREAMACRLAMVVGNLNDAMEGLRTWLDTTKGNSGATTSIPFFTGTRKKDYSDGQNPLLSIHTAENSLEKLAAHWANGDDVPWEKLWESRPFGTAAVKKLSLPTYPFEKRRCWFEVSHNGIDVSSASEENLDEAAGSSLEMELADIWSDLLGIKPIGLHDNFFELGGSSFLAVRLFARIQKKFGGAYPVNTIVKAPTIARLADMIRSRERTIPQGTLVEIQAGGTKPPLFCIPPLNRTVMSYIPLAGYLGPDQPVYGLQHQGMDGEAPPHTRVEDMAAHYLNAILSFDAKGPYYLAGMCFGGVVAYELARQLQAQGLTVAFVGMLDSGFHEPEQERPKKTFVKADHYIHLVSTRFKIGGKVRWAMKSIIYVFHPLIRSFVRMIDPLERRSQRIGKVHGIALRAYVSEPKHYQGEITLFRSIPDNTEGKEKDLHFPWPHLAFEDFQCHTIEGSHSGILFGPQVAALATQLAGCLDRARIHG